MSTGVYEDRSAAAVALSAEISKLGQQLEQVLISISHEGSALRAAGDVSRARVYEGILGSLDPVASGVFPPCRRSLEKLAASFEAE